MTISKVRSWKKRLKKYPISLVGDPEQNAASCLENRFEGVVLFLSVIAEKAAFAGNPHRLQAVIAHDTSLKG